MNNLTKANNRSAFNLSNKQLLLEIIAMSLLVFTFVFVYLRIGSLPNTIVTHYDLNGKADAFGPKESLYSDIKTSFWLYILISIIQLISLINDYYSLTANDTVVPKKLSVFSKLSIIKILVIFVFLVIIFIPISKISWQENDLKLLFIALFIAAFLPSVYFLIINKIHKKSKL